MSSKAKQQQSDQVVAHFFRQEYARAVAWLTRKSGPEPIAQIEDSFEDALIYLRASRFETRTSQEGALITHKDQDRTRWNNWLIEDGIFYLTQHSKGNLMTEYHVQTTIAAYHCTSGSYRETEWESILKLYDYQVSTFPNPVAALNRCVAYAEVHGSDCAPVELERLNKSEKLEKYYLYHAIKGKLQADCGMHELACKEWEKTIENTDNIIEKNYLLKLLENESKLS